MKKTHILIPAAALLLLSSQIAHAKDGSDGSSSGSSGGTTQTASPSPASSSGSGDSMQTSARTGASSRTSVEPETENIQSVKLEAEAGSGKMADSELSNDANNNTVVVEHKDGKPVEVTTSGGSEKSEKELAGTDGVTVQSTDSHGSKHTIKIKAAGGGFKVLDDGTEADTNFPLEIDPKTNTLSVVTPAGTVEVKVLPSQAVNAIENNKTLDEVDSVELETSAGSPAPTATVSPSTSPAPSGTEADFKVAGINNVNFLGLFPVAAKETVSVNVQTGAIHTDSKPWFLNILGFLFSGK